jgi:hypothetical protein
MKIGSSITGDFITDMGNSIIFKHGDEVLCLDLHQYSRVQVQHLIDQMQEINNKARPCK